jgi:hypothetical protein
MQHSLLLLLFSFPLTAIAQQRVLFADSLEERSEVNTIKNPVEYESEHHMISFTKMKMGERSLKNFEIHSEHFEDPQTKAQNKKTRVPLYVLRYFVDGTVIGEPIHTNANFNVSDHFSYQLIGPGSNQVRVSGIRSSIETYQDIHVKNTTISKIKPDTSYLSAELLLNDQKEACILDALFLGDGPASIGGIALVNGDTIFIRTTNKAKKYHALGVELSLHHKVIAGVQLPDMHIGPSYSVVDNTLPDDLKNMVYGILSVILYTNENRLRDF